MVKPPTVATPADSCGPVAATVDAAALNAAHKTLADMIQLGDTVQTRLRYIQCEFNAARQRKEALVASGRDLRHRLEDYQSQVGLWQAAYAKLNQHLTDYYENCVGEPVDEDHYLSCKLESDRLDAERKALDDMGRPLQQRNQELNAATARYAAQVRDAQQDYEIRRQEDTDAMGNQARWLSQSFQLVFSPAFAPYAAANGCPSLTEVPGDAEALLALGDGTLSCFRRAGSAAATP